MHRVRPLADSETPLLAPYRTLRAQGDHLRQGVFVAEGEKGVRRLLASSLVVESILTTSDWLAALRPELDRRAEEIPVVVADHGEIEHLAGFTFFQGVLAVGRIPEAWTVDRLLARRETAPLWVALDGLTNSENLGVIVRNCRALGVDALIQGPGCASPFLRRSVRGSMGAVFDLPIVATDDLAATLRRFSENGIRTIAAHPAAGGATLFRTDLTGGRCLVFGHEGHGVSEAVLASCDTAVAVPMAAGVDSLNVASCVAVFLGEALRQRSAAG